MFNFLYIYSFLREYLNYLNIYENFNAYKFSLHIMNKLLGI